MNADGRGITTDSRLTMPDEHASLIRAMVDAVHALVELPHPPALLDSLLGQAIWDVTQYREGYIHKYGGLRWRTRDAHSAARPPWKNLRHEHVVERSWILRLLRATPDATETALWNLPVALVTKDEVDRLRARAAWGPGWGWARYSSLDLTILDARNGAAVDLDEMNDSLLAVYAPLVGRARAAGVFL